MVLSQLQLRSSLAEDEFNVGIGVFGVSIILSWGRLGTAVGHQNPVGDLEQSSSTLVQPLPLESPFYSTLLF